MDSLSKEYQSERGLMRNIYENFECHLGTVGLGTSTRCVEWKSHGLKDGNHFEKGCEIAKCLNQEGANKFFAWRQAIQDE